MHPYDVGAAAVGVAILGAALVPLVLAGRPLSFPIIYVALGMVVFALPIGLPAPDPIVHRELVERLAELAVITSLMGAGLKLDRPLGWRSWRVTWRLLAVAMPLTIALVALSSWAVVGLAPSAALLFAAATSPTDPVLASDVQVGPPGQGEEDDVRFALTSEAGLNDGLAFPFTWAAVAAVGATSVGEWVGRWLLEDVALRLAIGVALGLIAGRALGWLAFRLPTERKLAESTEGFVALGATLATYGITQLAHGYGFIAVFVCACALRARERGHDYHEVLHASAEGIERLLSALLLVLLGGALVGGILGPLRWASALVVLGVVLMARPVAGLVALAGSELPPGERAAIAFFGIRGIGSIYYLAFALNQADFSSIPELWAMVAFAVALSTVLHGISASPVMRRLDQRRQRTAESDGSTIEPAPPS